MGDSSERVVWQLLPRVVYCACSMSSENVYPAPSHVHKRSEAQHATIVAKDANRARAYATVISTASRTVTLDADALHISHNDSAPAHATVTAYVLRTESSSSMDSMYETPSEGDDEMTDAFMDHIVVASTSHAHAKHIVNSNADTEYLSAHFNCFHFMIGTLQTVF